MSLERSSSRRRVVILICFVLFIATILLVLIGAYLGKKVETVGIAEKEVGYPDWKIYRFWENKLHVYSFENNIKYIFILYDRNLISKRH